MLRTHFSMDTDAPVPSIPIDELPVIPVDNDTASGRDDAGAVFLWRYSKKTWTKIEPWSPNASVACVRAADRMALYHPFLASPSAN